MWAMTQSCLCNKASIQSKALRVSFPVWEPTVHWHAPGSGEGNPVYDFWERTAEALRLHSSYLAARLFLSLW